MTEPTRMHEEIFRRAVKELEKLDADVDLMELRWLFNIPCPECKGRHYIPDITGVPCSTCMTKRRPKGTVEAPHYPNSPDAEPEADFVAIRTALHRAYYEKANFNDRLEMIIATGYFRKCRLCNEQIAITDTTCWGEEGPLCDPCFRKKYVEKGP